MFYPRVARVNGFLLAVFFLLSSGVKISGQAHFEMVVYNFFSANSNEN